MKTDWPEFDSHDDDEIDYDELDLMAAAAPDVDWHESCPIPTVDEMEQLIEQGLLEEACYE